MDTISSYRYTAKFCQDSQIKMHWYSNNRKIIQKKMIELFDTSLHPLEASLIDNKTGQIVLSVRQYKKGVNENL